MIKSLPKNQYSSPLAFSKLIFLILLTITTLLVLSFIYRSLEITSTTFINVLAINIILASFIIIYNNDPRAITLRQKKYSVSFVCYTIGLLIFLILGFLVKKTPPSSHNIFIFNHLILILIVPIFEEIVYRIGIGQIFRSVGGNLWGGYFSAMVFSLVHGLPTKDHMLSLQLGVFLGPLLLGAICEYTYIKTRSIIPCIIFHMLGNTAALVIMSLDMKYKHLISDLYLF